MVFHLAICCPNGQLLGDLVCSGKEVCVIGFIWKYQYLADINVESLYIYIYIFIIYIYICSIILKCHWSSFEM